ncbi:MAG: adenylate cyclase [Rhizobiales bacterium]|nr:adenylate cyclase [Hyphomicrobiales bacterium]
MDDRPPQRKLAAILVADAVGYSRRMGLDEEGTLRALNARRDIIEKSIAQHHGRVFGEAGDSVVAEFSSAVEALKAAIEAQDAIASVNDAVPKTDEMQFRIGINLGDVIAEGDNLFGDGVNVAERLQSLAKPGSVCVSGSVHEQVRDKLLLGWNDLGEQSLKNIARPVRAYIAGGAVDQAVGTEARRSRLLQWQPTGIAVVIALLALIGGAYLYLMPSRETPSAESSGPPIIAVLPFTNLSADSKDDYFSDGITRDIIGALGRFSSLSVLASTATARFKGRDADSADLQRELKARYVVTGTVQREGDRVRVAADLNDTEKNYHLWSRQFDRKIRDIFAVQDEITRDVVGALAIKISRIEQERAYARGTDRLEAYDYLLRGRSLLPASDRVTNLEARALFEKAIAADPKYAAAYAWLGQTYLAEVFSGWTEFGAEVVDRAEEFGRHAVAFSPDLAEGYQLLASAELVRGRYDRAVALAKRAVEINQSDASGYATLGTALMWGGDAQGAIAALERAKLFDPTLPWDSILPLGFAYYFVARYSDAVDALEPIAKTAGDYGIYAFLAASYAQLGRVNEASQAKAEVKRLWPFFDISAFVAQWKDEKSRSTIEEGLKKAGL